jgi:hypothetical protein
MIHSEERELEKGLKIRLVAPVYFCASKLEAFASRGENDFSVSRDLEDLIAVVDGRAELVGEIQAAANDVRSTSPRKSRSCSRFASLAMLFQAMLRPMPPARTELA